MLRSVRGSPVILVAGAGNAGQDCEAIGTGVSWSKLSCWRRPRVERVVENRNLLALFGKLHVWHARGQRAPHKPLLVLWAIGRCLRGEPRMVSYSDVAVALAALLREFGPSRRAIHTSFPFWRLRGDGVWALEGADRVTVTKSGDAHEGALRRHDVHGGFPKTIYDGLHDDPGLARQVARSLMDKHFPPTLHHRILRTVGIDPDLVESRRRRRDSGFRRRVLDAYIYKCAVCGFAVRLDDRPVAIDAAHIRWHQADGPATIPNGIALCTLHHELFDAGTFTLTSERLQSSGVTYSRTRRSTLSGQRVAEVGPMTVGLSRPVVLVAPLVTGEGVEEALGRYDGMPVHLPADRELWPAAAYLKWHGRQVFKYVR